MNRRSFFSFLASVPVGIASAAKAAEPSTYQQELLLRVERWKEVDYSTWDTPLNENCDIIGRILSAPPQLYEPEWITACTVPPELSS